MRRTSHAWRWLLQISQFLPSSSEHLNLQIATTAAQSGAFISGSASRRGARVVIDQRRSESNLEFGFRSSATRSAIKGHGSMGFPFKVGTHGEGGDMLAASSEVVRGQSKRQPADYVQVGERPSRAHGPTRHTANHLVPSPLLL